VRSTPYRSLPERLEIDLHAVQHRAPVPRYRGHCDSFADLLIGGAIRFGDGDVDVDAIMTWNLRSDSEAD
jgi:hypothetical protein